MSTNEIITSNTSNLLTRSQLEALVRAHNNNRFLFLRVLPLFIILGGFPFYGDQEGISRNMIFLLLMFATSGLFLTLLRKLYNFMRIVTLAEDSNITKFALQILFTIPIIAPLAIAFGPLYKEALKKRLLAHNLTLKWHIKPADMEEAVCREDSAEMPSKPRNGGLRCVKILSWIYMLILACLAIGTPILGIILIKHSI